MKQSWVKAAKLVKDFGIEYAMQEMGWNRESVRRAVRAVRTQDKPGENANKQPAIIKKILERYTDDELRIIAEGKTINPNQHNRPVIDFDGEQVTICFATDTHIGSKYFSDHLWVSMLKECEKQGVQSILFGGDLIEGMSNRPDQVYSLDDIGFSAQMDHATELLAMTEIPIYTIDGNHDRWGIKSGGVFAVKDIANRLDHVTFLGHDMGTIDINGTSWMLWHGEDGSSYATSYRVQKIIEAFTGGNKPQVLLCGHTHKQLYIFERNVHAVSGGALSYQSAWMQSKRLANHTGFHIIMATIRDSQIVSFSPTFYPFYN